MERREIGIERVRWYEWGGGRPGWEEGERRRSKATPVATGEAAIERAAATLSGGGVVVHPTSTVYGLGGRPGAEVDARIAAMKGRPAGPLIRLAATRPALQAALPTVRWNEAAERLAGAFWPGPLTLVLDDGSEWGVAVRVEGHPVTRALLVRAGGLMTSTSLNATGGRPARTRDEVWAALDELDPVSGPGGVLEAGDLDESPPSTLVSVRTAVAEVLREGAISRARVDRVLA